MEEKGKERKGGEKGDWKEGEKGDWKDRPPPFANSWIRLLLINTFLFAPHYMARSAH